MLVHLQVQKWLSGARPVKGVSAPQGGHISEQTTCVTALCAETALGQNAFKVTYWRMKRLLAHFYDPEILLSCVWLYESTAQQWTVWVDELLSELL